MTTLDNSIAAISSWLSKVAASALPNIQISSTSWLGKAMNGFFGIDLNTYNVWHELGFLATPAIQMLVEPTLRRYMSMIPEEKLPEALMTIADKCLEQAQTKGYVNVFGIQLGPNVFEGLKDTLKQALQ